MVTSSYLHKKSVIGAHSKKKEAQKMHCIKCKSENVIKNGYYKDYQKYRCKDCNKQSSERSFSFFCRHRFPEEVIKNAILFGCFVSTRNVVFLIKETVQFTFAHVTAFNWMKKFAHLLSKLKRNRSFSNIWHIDEKFIKIKGIEDFAYLWVVMDDLNNMVAVHVSKKRDIEGAVTSLEKAKTCADKPPDIIVSDGLQAYKKAVKKVFGRRCKHVKRHFKAKAIVLNRKIIYLSNNRLEGLNSKINLWYKKFRGFKSIGNASLWCEMWMYFYNLMRPRVIPHKIISIHQIL